MEKSINKGDFVLFYNAGYTATYVGDDGEQDIWDWHHYSHGKVLLTMDDKALVLFHKRIDDESINVDVVLYDEMYTSWVEFKNLTKKEEPEKFRVFSGGLPK